MGQTAVTRTVRAPIANVFDAIAHIESFAEIVPEIVKVEFLSDQKRGLGARFRETRLMGKREAATELEVTEYVENERVRMVADAGGTIWDTLITTREVGDGEVELAMVMESRPYKLAAKLFTPLISGMLRKALAKDLDAVKAHCEG